MPAVRVRALANRPIGLRGIVSEAPQSDPSPDEVGELFRRLDRGDADAFNALVETVYEELREIAHRHRMRWRGNKTVSTTVLVHEAYLKLSRHEESWAHRSHFLAVASRAMRQILIDYARGQQRVKRGGEFDHVPIDFAPEVADILPESSLGDGERLLDLDRSPHAPGEGK